MENEPLEVDDLIVLLLGAPTGIREADQVFRGITRLEKLVFLAIQELKPTWLTEEPRFVAYNFGPFSKDVYDAVSVLSAAELILDTGAESNSTEDTWEQRHYIDESEVSYRTRDFSLTDRGRRYYQSLLAILPQNTDRMLAAFKKKYAELPLKQLIRYVYMTYPDFAAKSVIRDEILKAHS